MSVPGYELQAELFRNTTSVFHRAVEVATGRVVCVERMPPMFEEFSIPVVERNWQVLQAVALVDHPNVWPIERVGQVGSTLHAVRPFLDGELLSTHIRHRPLTAELAIDWVCQLALAAQHAHDLGIYHADIKPGNVFLADDVPLLFGFDSASIVDFLPPPYQEAREGMIAGTPAYMSPEVVTGRRHEADGRIDVWALGVLLAELLTGRSPFQAASAMETIQRVMQAELTAADLPGVAPALQRICLRCLKIDREKRYATATELAEALARYQRGEPDAPPTTGGAIRGWMRRMLGQAR